MIPPPTNLDVHFDGFNQETHPQFQVMQSLSVSQAECVHAAVSVGAPFFFVGTPPSNDAVQFALFKALALILSVEISSIGINRRREYDRLDSTEKRNLSYWLGMTFAAVAARRSFDVAHLVHAESMHKAKRLLKTKGSGKRLADLIGQDSKSRWHVVEAKCRQAKASAKEVVKWKKQAGETVDTIDGVAPYTMSCSSLTLAGRASVLLIDPQPNSQAASIRFEDSRRDLQRWYYSPWVAALRADLVGIELGSSVGYVAASHLDTISGRRVDVGLTEQTWKATSVGELYEASAIAADGQSFVGRDGIFVRIIQEAPVRRSPA